MNFQLTDHSLAPFEWPPLEHLDLTYATKITNIDFLSHPSLAGLRSLDLSTCTALTAAGFASIRNLKSLEHLAIDSCLLRDKAIACIIACSNLRSLSMSRNDSTTGAMKMLALLPRLEVLSLRHCASVTNGVLKALKAAPALQELDVNSCTNFGPRGLALLVDYPNLKKVDLRNTELTRACLSLFQNDRPDLQLA